MGPLQTSLWQDFWHLHNDATINWIETPRLGSLYFTMPLYALLLILFIVLVFVYRPINKNTLIKVYIVSCIIIGTLFALRMDYTWFEICSQDKLLSSKSVYERQIILLPPPSTVIIAKYMKEVLHPTGYVRIYSNDDYFKLSLKYHLLPVEVSDSGSCIVVYQGNIVYDSVHKLLTQEGRTIAENVVFVTNFISKKGIIYIYQIMRTDN